MQKPVSTGVVADYMGCYCSDLGCEFSCFTEIAGDGAESWEAPHS